MKSSKSNKGKSQELSAPNTHQSLCTEGFVVHEAEGPLQRLHRKKALANKDCTRVIFPCTRLSAKHSAGDLEAPAITCNLNKLASKEQGREKGCSQALLLPAQPSHSTSCLQHRGQGRTGMDSDRLGKGRAGAQRPGHRVPMSTSIARPGSGPARQQRQGRASSLTSLVSLPQD